MGRKKVLRQPLDRLLTTRATRVLVLAREAAAAHHHDLVFPEHLLLGLTRLNEGVALHSLMKLGVSLQATEAEVEQGMGHGMFRLGVGEISYSPGAEQVLGLARQEAYGLGHSYVGTEHLLLGLIGEGNDGAAGVLLRSGVDLPDVRLKVIEVLHSPRPPEWA